MSGIGVGVGANLRDSAGTMGIVDFRGAGPVVIEWRLQGSLLAIVEGGVMAKLIQIRTV